MKPKDINKLNQQKYVSKKLNKYCPKCKKVYYVSDYTSRCKVCTTLLECYSQNSKDVSYNTPKCPTCGSTNVAKISTTSKVAGAALFGLFSTTARSQFKCKNCGMKF